MQENYFESKQIREFETNYKNRVKEYKLINESSLSRIFLKYKESDSGVISAFRNEYTYRENMGRSKQLKNILVSLGYSVTKIIGKFIEDVDSKNPKEVKGVSFIVFDRLQTGDLLNDLKKLANKFDQDSITFAKADDVYYLYGINGYPVPGKTEKLGKPSLGFEKPLMFASMIKGRQFEFRVDESIGGIDDHRMRHTPTENRSFELIEKEFLFEDL